MGATRRREPITAAVGNRLIVIKFKRSFDKAYANSKAPDGPPIRHANIRGRGYYH
jgi:hypothetical protein